MNIDYIREFLVLADVLNYSRASFQLGVSQPVLSRHIQELERHFGVILLARSTRGISLTPAGRELVRSGGVVSSAYDQMMTRMQIAEQEYLGYVHVGVIPSVMLSAASKATASAREHFSHVVIKLHDMAPALQLKAIDNRQIDIALPGQVPGHLLAAYNTTVLAEIPLMAVMSEHHRFSKRAELDLAELSREEFVILYEKTFPGRFSYVKSACNSVGFEPRCTDHVDGLSAMLNAVSTGRWMALLPALVQDIAHDGVVFCRLKQEDLKVKSYALTRLDENREIVASFIQELKKASMEVYSKYNA